MTATNPHDRETVKRLLAEHVPSGFPRETAPLTVGDVACRLKADRAIGRDPIPAADVDVNINLLVDPTPMGGKLTPRRIDEIRELGGLRDGSARYWELFRCAAIEMLMARAPGGPTFVVTCERTEGPTS